MNGKDAVPKGVPAATDADWRESRGVVFYKLEDISRRIDRLEKRIWAMLIGIVLIAVKGGFDIFRGI